MLLSLGFRPTYLAPDRLWRLSAIVALAMIDAAEDLAGLPAGILKLKWPNDVVVTAPAGGGFLKVAGILGESDGAGTTDPGAVVADFHDGDRAGPTHCYVYGRRRGRVLDGVCEKIGEHLPQTTGIRLDEYRPGRRRNPDLGGLR